MNCDLIVVRFGEVFLKGQNRPMFLDRLRENLKRAVAGTGWRVEGRHGRFMVVPEDPKAPTPLRKPLERAARVFGVTSVSPAVRTTTDLDEIADKAVALATARVPPDARTFRVAGRRSDKSLPYTSTQLGAHVGYAVGAAIQIGVDLKHPDFDIGVEVGDLSFVYAERRRGPGGLPVGVSGKVQVLLSGGIDSPVAAWMAMKRGCRVEGVYFHSFPLIGDAARDKVMDLAGVLGAWAASPMKVRVVPFAEAQKAVRDRCDPRLYVLLYRRLMFRISERIARRTKAKALVTGESLGQVASQTLENLDVIGAVADMPVLRPLIGLDKQETVDRAKAIGTFDISALPHEDCCSLFVPKHPETKAKRSALEIAEQALDIDGMVEAALAGVEVEEVRPAAL